MAEEIFVTFEDEVTNKKYGIKIIHQLSALVIQVEDNPDVYIGVEIWDGALRGLFGEDAEVIMNDPGVIVEERFTDASD